MPCVVWAKESKTGLGFEIGPSHGDVPTTSQCATAWQSSCIPIDINRHNFWAEAQQLDFSKDIFPTNQVTSEGPETSVLELLTRGIYVTWLNSFRKFVIYVFFFTCQTMKIELGPQHQWMRLNESFSCVISDLVQPSRYLGKLFVCVSVFDGQSSCTQVTDNITKNMLRWRYYCLLDIREVV